MGMLAVVRVLGECRAELEGLQQAERFRILTNHRALEYFMTTRKAEHTPGQMGGVPFKILL